MPPKNAILIVEFAKQLEDQGRNRWEAAAEAAELRLRPILMTSLAFILGVVPLVIAIGAGAELRQALGTAVFSGMIGVTVFGLIFTPVFYVISRWLADRRGAERRQARHQVGNRRNSLTPADYLMKFGVGQSVRRKEDDPLLRGAGHYVADHAPDGLLHGLVVRSPHAHARFKITARDKARAMPGVQLVLTAQDIADLGLMPCTAGVPGQKMVVPPYPVLARTRSAMSATRSPSSSPIRSMQARDAAEAIEIEWEPLPHVVGAEAALEKDAPQVWPDRPGNLAFEVDVRR